MLGQTIGNFRIVSKLGHGGMGEIYVGEQQNVRTNVAIKILRPEVSTDTQLVQRFFNEAVAVSRIKHAGITKIFDVGFHGDGRAYLIMELLDGETLASRIHRSGRLSTWQLADVGKQIASILDATHAAGITHRDLKPENIFVVPDRELPSGERVKILDFGIAKLSGLSGASSGSMGTPAYMAPEQWRDAAAVDWRGDAYALGCVAFEMATGRPPFVVDTVGEACTAHLTLAPPSVRSLVRDAPALLDDLLAKLLAKAPEDRPASMREIGRAFETIGVGQPRLLDDTLAPAAMEGPRGSTTTTQVPSRRRWVVGIAAGIAMGGVTGAVLWSQRAHPAPGIAVPPGDAEVAIAPDAAIVEAPVAAAEPPLANPWVRISPPPHPVILGIDSDAAPADRRGFRPARKIASPSKPYEIHTHEVTWSEIEPWLPTSGNEAPGRPSWAKPTTNLAKFPVTGIAWTTAYAYCKSLGGSLPTEEQWEFAARGADRRPNAWGRRRLDLALTHVFAGRGAHPVEVATSDQDRTPEPPIYDLIGNAQEWTADLWREDVTGRDESWVQDGQNTYRAIRGFPLAASSPRIQADGAAFREPLCATGPCVERIRDRLANVGFRCARGDAAPSEPVAIPPRTVVKAAIAPPPSPPSPPSPPIDDAVPIDAPPSPIDAPPVESKPHDADGETWPDKLDRQMIADGVAKVRSTIDACGTAYRGATVLVAVTVKPDGKVSNVSVRNTPDDWLGTCVAQRIKAATFEATTHGGTFSWPFSF